MNLLQFYLAKLAEEGVEVAQIALKTAQFGPHEIMPGQPHTNFERVHQELDDFWAMIEELNEQYGFNYTPNEAAIHAKRLKVRRFLDYSMQLGMVQSDT